MQETRGQKQEARSKKNYTKINGLDAERLKSDIYFISDVHMDGDASDREREKERRLISFLDGIREKAEVLYIVGDLFDFWFEYRKAVPNRYFRILRKLSEIVDSGTRVVFIPGNHDVWAGQYLQKEIGFDVKKKHADELHQGLRFYIAHGDGMARGEGLYRIQKWIMENKINIWLYKLLHPDLGIPLARWVSKLSKKRSQSKEPGWNSREYKDAAIKKLGEGYDVVVLAHIHSPALEEMSGKQYLNTGDWIRNFSYGRLRDGHLTLEKWTEPSENEVSC